MLETVLMNVSLYEMEILDSVGDIVFTRTVSCSGTNKTNVKLIMTNILLYCLTELFHELSMRVITTLSRTLFYKSVTAVLYVLCRQKNIDNHPLEWLSIYDTSRHSV